jgi:hypothetical protein
MSRHINLSGHIILSTMILRVSSDTSSLLSNLLPIPSFSTYVLSRPAVSCTFELMLMFFCDLPARTRSHPIVFRALCHQGILSTIMRHQ